MGVAISLAELAAAVANEGGIGIIASIGINRDEPDVYTDYVASSNRAVKNEIKKARGLSKGIIGINIMVAITNYAETVQAAIEEGIDIIISGAGLPMHLPKYKIEAAVKSDTALVPICSSGRSAAIICRTWDKKYNYTPDAIVVEGPLAGGHLGFSPDELSRIDEYSLEKLVADVIEEVKPYEAKYGRKIPVIAGGGVYSGEDIVKFIKLGAAGVQMATRFVATDECNAHPKFKEAYINAKAEDIVLIQSPVGLPGRAVRSNFVTAVENGKKIPIKCPYHCLITCKVEDSPYCIALALTNATKGNFDHGFVFCGSNASRIDRIMSVKELMDSLVAEADAVV